MAEKWENWPKNGPKMVIFPFFGHFSPVFPGGARIHFSAIFSPFRAGGNCSGALKSTSDFARLKCNVQRWGLDLCFALLVAVCC